MKQLVLASSSAPRQALLDKLHFPYIADPSNYEEDMTLDLSPKDLAIELSRGKARDVAGRHKNAVVLGADSFVVCDGQLLGKPHTIERAKEMLKTLSGRTHTFITGYTIIDTDTKREVSEAVETTVRFRDISSEEIDRYLAKEDTRKNAGAYRIQDIGTLFAESVEGNFDNIIGLPLAQVCESLKPFGIFLL